MTPYYTDDHVTVHHGDCLEVLAGLPDSSVDAVVTDPPYGLEFMGKDWDAPWKADGENLWATRDKSEDLTGKSSSPFLAAAVNKYRAGLPFQSWCETWAVECLRVLKPGGFIAAFGGTRTFHRLACAIEDAGFEIRDSIGYGHSRPSVLAWGYGSGFPKSLNVTKSLEALPVCSCKDASAVSGGSLSSHELAAVDSVSPAGSVRAGIGTEAGAVPFTGLSADAGGIGAQVVAGSPVDSGPLNVDAVDEQAVGQCAPVVLRSATVASGAEREQVSGLVGGVEVDPESLWDQVMGDESVGGSTVGAGPVSGDDGCGNAGPSTAFVLPLTAAPNRIPCTDEPGSVVGAHAVAGAVDGVVGPAPELVAAEGADVDAVASTFHATDFTAERLNRCETCGGRRGAIPQGLGTSLKPAWEPIVLARKPLQGTVAANVLAYGTGALNVDGCRVATTDRWEASGVQSAPGTALQGSADGSLNVSVSSTHESGRWPANVLLDGTQADALDKESGISKSSPIGFKGSNRNTYDAAGRSGPLESRTGTGDYGDEGGASRFFPTFHYTAKAPGTERPTADGISHPTVKPVELMRWLIRLVTPPGGVVLDPFAGSGTTGEAAIHEHKRAILIEREPTYLPVIVARLHKPMQVGFNFDEPCASAFLGAHCQHPAGHTGDHHDEHSSGYVTVWTDPAADQEAVS